VSPSPSALARGSGPLYLQLATLMRRRIETGEWGAGSQIPTLDELAREFGLARVTIRQALEILETEGLLRRRQGLGTFIAPRLPDRRWLRLGGDWKALLAMAEGLSPRLLAIEDSARQPRIDPEEGIPAPAYKHMRRLHATPAGSPFCLIDLYLDQRVFRRAPRTFRTRTVLPVLEELGKVEIGRARQTLTIGTADVETARHLALPLNAPIAEVRRVVVDTRSNVVYLAELIYRGDAIKLEIDLLGVSGDRGGNNQKGRNRT
jgi:GntR family transcriptional regulator